MYFVVKEEPEVDGAEEEVVKDEPEVNAIAEEGGWRSWFVQKIQRALSSTKG